MAHIKPSSKNKRTFVKQYSQKKKTRSQVSPCPHFGYFLLSITYQSLYKHSVVAALLHRPLPMAASWTALEPSSFLLFIFWSFKMFVLKWRVTQQLRTHTVLPEDLNLSPSTQIRWHITPCNFNSRRFNIFACFRHRHSHACAHRHIHICILKLIT